MSPTSEVGVLTFHRCINYGSYWQARCLTEGLQRRGLDAVLLDHQSASVNRAEWRCALQPARPARTPKGDLAEYRAKARKFFDAFLKLPLSNRFDLDAPEESRPFRKIVVGSDEVWNFRHPWYAGRPLFFGSGLRTDRLVSYAASFGNHNATDGVDIDWAERLGRFSAIAVRDDNSRDLIRAALGIDAPVVLDPCLQFAELCRREPEDRWSSCAVVYGHSFPDWFVRAIKAWSAAHGVRLVSIGYSNDWAAEKWIAAGPEDFARAMAGAAAVVTNFFHGCVFALLNARPFVSVLSDYRSNKVRDLLTRLGAERHLASEASDEDYYESVLSGPLDPAIQDRIATLRRDSDAYLTRALQ